MSALQKNPIEKCFSKITPYHYYFFFLLFLSKLPIFWHILSLIFLTPPMNYYCVEGDNSTKNQCPCESPVWDRSVFTETIQTKYDIVCEKSWLISFSQSLMYVGTLIGSFAFGFLSDRFGRLFMFSVCCLLLGLFGYLVTLMPTISSFTLMRCLEGIGLGGAIVTSYVLCVEFCATKHREIVTALYHIPINLSHGSLSGISYLLRNCDSFQLAISVPLVFFVALNWITLESPKWLMDNDHVDKAATIMEKFLHFNRMENQSIRQEMEEYHETQKKTVRLRMKFWQIFKHRQLSINFLCMCVIYFVCGMGYYGVSQYIGLMSGNIHVNVAISGFLLLPGTLSAILLLKILKRRTFLIITNFMSGVLMLVVVAVPDHYNLPKVFVACICNCFFFMSFIIVFLYGVELFPTAIRNSVLGVLSVLARVGQIVAPVVNTTSSVISGVIFGLSALLAACVCYPLPETKGTELPSSLEDSKMLPHRGSSTPRDNVTITQQ